MIKIGILLLTCLFLANGSVLTDEELKELENAPFISVEIEEEGRPESRSLKDAVTQAKRICKCEGNTCGCCTKYTIFYIGIKGCINIKLIPKEKIFEVTITVAGRNIYLNRMEAGELEKVCSTVPKIKSAELCLVNTLEEHGEDGFKSCMSLDISYKKILVANINFQCLKYANNKLSFEENLKTGSKEAMAHMKLKSPLELLAKLIKSGLKKLEVE